LLNINFSSCLTNLSSSQFGIEIAKKRWLPKTSALSRLVSPVNFLTKYSSISNFLASGKNLS
jgi:hypothetical protein